jgi:hypothetical protein
VTGDMKQKVLNEKIEIEKLNRLHEQNRAWWMRTAEMGGSVVICLGVCWMIGYSCKLLVSKFGGK